MLYLIAFFVFILVLAFKPARKLLGYAFIGTVIGVPTVLAVSYFTIGDGNPDVALEKSIDEALAKAERKKYVTAYCVGMQKDGYFKNNLNKCIEQNTRAWDLGPMRDEIKKGWQG